MAYSHVAHDCDIREGVVIANGCQLGGHVRIGEYATIGGVTGIQQRNQVGAYAFVGGTHKVDRDVPPCVKASGTPSATAGSTCMRSACIPICSPRNASRRFPAPTANFTAAAALSPRSSKN